MKVLYYNWVDYQDPENRGGGVTVYQRNLINAIEQTDIETTFLSAGTAYDLPLRAPYWQPLSVQERRYEIVNSGVLAPAHFSFGADAQIAHSETERAFFDFLEQTGPYDVIHFNNLEGIPASVLDLKKQFPQAKVVYTLHNYYPICPQVNLWNAEQQTCDDFEAGARCTNCIKHVHDPRMVRLAGGITKRLMQLHLRTGGAVFDFLFKWSFRVAGRCARALSRLRSKETAAIGSSPTAEYFATRRATMTELINNGCDAVLCVSDAVNSIAEQYGISKDLLHTSYIGTPSAQQYTTSVPATRLKAEGSHLTIAYLGYMRRDKGFFFLLDTLEALPDKTLARLHIVVAARSSREHDAMKRLRALAKRCHTLTHHDGYLHSELSSILAPVDIGVVPVLWHDNLPQVAIEMHARRIPILTADIGGAKELSNTSEFTFKAGDTAALTQKITALLDGELELSRYWDGATAPCTMTQHAQELNSIYRSL